MPRNGLIDEMPLERFYNPGRRDALHSDYVALLLSCRMNGLTDDMPLQRYYSPAPRVALHATLVVYRRHAA